VAHPSGETPYSALALAELAERAGVPAGVFNVVTGRAATVVEPWTEDTRVRALSFTGSTNIGQLLYRQCAGTVKKLVMELGGHAPVIVFRNADLDTAIEESIKAKFATSGQDCRGGEPDLCRTRDLRRILPPVHRRDAKAAARAWHGRSRYSGR